MEIFGGNVRSLIRRVWLMRCMSLSERVRFKVMCHERRRKLVIPAKAVIWCRDKPKSADGRDAISLKRKAQTTDSWQKYKQGL
jgi:hypothetical protein